MLTIMAVYEFESESEADTERFGAMIASELLPGDVFSLSGTLGAGKTRLVQAIAVGLGANNELVTSPTFVLVNEYRSGRIPVYHLDVYRLKDDDEFLELGPEEMCDAGGATLIEWGDRVRHLLPPRTQAISIEILDGEGRHFRVEGDLATRLAKKHPS